MISHNIPPPPPPPLREGYIQGKLMGDRILVYLGIIDILQSYRLKKKFEHTLKSMITDGVSLSPSLSSLSPIPSLSLSL